MANLYEINAEVNQLLDLVDTETGEIPCEVLEKLEALQVTESDKLEGAACKIKNLNSYAIALKAEEKALSDRRKTIEKQSEGIKRYISEYMNSTGKERFETSKCALSFRQSKAVNIVDEDALKVYAIANNKYLKYGEPTFNKTEISTALKNGEVIPGAELAVNQNLQIK